MHKIEIPSKNTVIEFPEEISEMTVEQYIAFCSLILQFTNKEISYGELRVQLTYVLLNLIRKVDVSKQNEQADAVSENVYRISQLMDCFFDTNEKDGKAFKTVKLDNIDNKIPSIEIQKHMYTGPADALTDLKFGQYIQALNAYIDYAKTKDEYYLNHLVATLYTAKDEALDNNSKDRKAALFSLVSLAQRYGVYLFFQGCQEWIATNRALDIGGGHTVDLSVLFIPSKNSESDGKSIGMLSAMYTLAESGVFGDMEKVANQNLYDALVYMVQKHNEVLKLKKNAKNTRSKGVS
ncbi:hypothetical protein ACE939_00905 [Aquimarina sp. W85]|uniref:hypothetical protein n=1 Tax=Aquimarina rhodophyticola TaxID=3342246 RepID=UPI00366B9173